MTPLDERRYQCCHEGLGPYRDRFVPLAPDAQNHAWLTAHTTASVGTLQRTCVSLLSPFMSLYDAHGLVGGHPMHLVSTPQLRDLVGDGHGRLLDVGAGAGFVTRYARPLTRELVCTETSRPLARKLADDGYRVLCCDIGADGLDDAEGFDAILCLNVLDRTPYPLRLLAALHALARPDTTLLLSLPLPLSPAVLVPGGSTAPEQTLPTTQESFEAGMRLLCEALLEPCGFEVLRLARAPYLSQGDADHPVYTLDAGLFVLRTARMPSSLLDGGLGQRGAVAG